MDCIKYIPVSGNLSLVSRLRRSLILNKCFQSRIGSIDTLNLVGCFGTLNLRNLNKLCQRICLRFYKKWNLPSLL